jgi:CheY-specific phosphatase CheX
MEVRQHLIQAFEEILDKMAYLYFEEPEEDEAPPGNGFQFVTQISFDGVISGSLNAFFTRNSAEEIARNLVGIRAEDELFEGTLEDAVCEFTNMVMGRTMTTLDPDHRFDMEVPRVVEEAGAPLEGTQTLDIAGILDDEPCKLVVHYREGRA